MAIVLRKSHGPRHHLLPVVGWVYRKGGTSKQTIRVVEVDEKTGAVRVVPVDPVSGSGCSGKDHHGRTLRLAFLWRCYRRAPELDFAKLLDEATPGAGDTGNLFSDQMPAAAAWLTRGELQLLSELRQVRGILGKVSETLREIRDGRAGDCGSES